MEEGELSAALRQTLLDRHLAPPFPPEAAADLIGVLRGVRLAPGEFLMRQGDSGEDVFLLVDGHLRVEVGRADGGTTPTGEICEGDVVGELALLTGQPRSASVIATRACELARLSRDDFERLAPHHPEALSIFLRRLLPRLKRTQVIRVLTELFGELDPAAIPDFLDRLVWRELPGGASLFTQGERSDDVFIVVNGRLRVSASDPGQPGGVRVIEEAGRGHAVGELALLTGEPRAASATAVRDSDLLQLSRRDFDALLDVHPRAMLQVARAAAWRLRSGSRGSVSYMAPGTFALVGTRPGLPLLQVAQALRSALAGTGSVALLSSAEVDHQLGRPGIAQVGIDDAIHESIVAWLAAVERDHRFLVLVADPGDTAWTRRCLRQADRVVLVGRADDNPAPGDNERTMEAMGLPARTELVLLHDPSVSRPASTAAWLAPRKVAAHHHVRLGNARDEGRLARRVSGQATALVLGGGGARGFSHIGVLRAIEEAGVDIDLVGGTSIGSVIAAGHAHGLGYEQQMELAAAFASRRKLMDRTLPVVALMKGAKLTRLYRLMFGEGAIEDLWMPFFAVSSGLSRAEAVVHERGSLWRAVRGSTAVPAIFPPLIAEDGEVLVDGNVMNNMPLDLMRERVEGGTLIGVNPMPIEPRMRTYRCGPSVSGWQALLGKWGLFGVKVRAPSIFGAVMRATEINSANRMRQTSFRQLADVLIEPPVGDYPILDYGQFRPIVEAGYRAGQEAMREWQAGRAAASGSGGGVLQGIALTGPGLTTGDSNV
jgi:predicted acylesterase/phospholipase RssA/CRP-like cAMP-binding protein